MKHERSCPGWGWGSLMGAKRLLALGRISAGCKGGEAEPVGGTYKNRMINKDGGITTGMHAIGPDWSQLMRPSLADVGHDIGA